MIYGLKYSFRKRKISLLFTIILTVRCSLFFWWDGLFETGLCLQNSDGWMQCISQNKFIFELVSRCIIFANKHPTKAIHTITNSQPVSMSSKLSLSHRILNCKGKQKYSLSLPETQAKIKKSLSFVSLLGLMTTFDKAHMSLMSRIRNVFLSQGLLAFMPL